MLLDSCGALSHIYFSLDCTEAVGLHSKLLVPDSSFTASSSDAARGHFPYNARLGQKLSTSAWCSGNVYKFQSLYVNLGKSVSVCQIAYQGNEFDNEWTSSIKMFYKDKETDWITLSDRHGNTVGI